MPDERRDHYLVFTEVSGAAAGATVAYTVPTGYTARIIYFAGYHNEGANLNAQFSLDNGIGLARDLHPVVSLATATLMQFYDQVKGLPENLILHQGWKLIFGAPVTAAHVNTYRLVAELRRGEAT